MATTKAKAKTATDLAQSPTLRFLSRGKVRDLYEISDIAEDGSRTEYLLFVATDRISAFDVILNNGVPGKGILLTRLSAFWFDHLNSIIPNHVVAHTLTSMPPGIRAQVEPFWSDPSHSLEGRTMLVNKAKVVPLEAIVRGYITGSAWSEYKKSGTVHGIPLPEGYVECAKLAEPLFTPSTKAAQGEHDENISPERAKELIGEDLYDQISSKAIALYKEAASYALSRGLILADTKFEFGLVPTSSLASSSSITSSTATATATSTPTSSSTLPSETLILVDEALTPDSSRYWLASSYTPGRPQESFDKQFLRDWLVNVAGFRKGLEVSGPDGTGGGWTMSEDVVEGTKKRYEECVDMIIGK